MNNSKKAIAGSVLVAVLAGCGGQHESTPRPQPADGAVAGDFDVAPCVHVAREVEYAAECGTLIVAENRYEPDSRLIALPVTRIPAKVDTPAEPIFSLAGGPGSSNMDYSRVEWFHENHDIVLVGYRGVDGSVYLDCPEVAEAMASGLSMMSRESMTMHGEASAACAERWIVEGVDLDQGQGCHVHTSTLVAWVLRKARHQGCDVHICTCVSGFGLQDRSTNVNRRPCVAPMCWAPNDG